MLYSNPKEVMDMDQQREAVQRMQDYIEAHLDGLITPADLARASHYSPWHAQRLFLQFTGLTPADYIRRLRLSRSALKLRDHAVTITEVAFSAGFQSVDGYQRAFLRTFGCNPHAYAANPVPICLFRPYGVKYALRKESPMENPKTVFVQLVEKPARKLILKRGRAAADYFSYCEEVGCDVWGTLTSIRSLIGEPECLWLPASLVPAGTSAYVQGVEVAPDDATPVPEGFDVLSLPACRYLMFRGEPFAEEDYCQAIEQVQCAISKYDPAPLGLSWDEENPRIQLEPIGTRGYIELLPVR